MKFTSLIVLTVLTFSFFGCAPKADERAVEIKKEMKKQLWTCSMHPQIRQDHPGKCPICGMNLVPIDDNEPTPTPATHDTHSAAPTSETISLSSAKNSVASVEVAEATLGSLKSDLTLFGEVKYVQDRHVDFTWVYGGRIEKVYITYNSTEVKEGEKVMEVYSEEAIADQEQYLQALRERYLTTFYERKVASAQVELYRQKLLRAGMTEGEIEELVKNKKIKTTFTLTAPISGSIVANFPHVGERFGAEMVLFHISALDEVWFSARVYEKDISALELNQKALISVKSYPNKKFEGKIIFIGRSLEPVSRTLEVRALVPNTEKLLLPDMSGEARVALKGENKVLLIPQSALIETGKRAIVYVQTDNSAYRQQEVTVGQKGQIGSQAMVEIIKGISAGEKVVTSGAFVIDAEAQLQGLDNSHQH